MAALAAALLGLRQQRLQMQHEMTRMHGRMDAARQQTWDLQVRIAEGTQPLVLQEALQRAGLELEPLQIQPSSPVSKFAFDAALPTTPLP